MPKQSSALGAVIHRFLRIPYTLHVEELQSPKKPRETIVFIHGIGNTLHAWDNLAKKFPKNIRIISVDLLGFGDSPKPRWVQYSAKTQARSVAATLLKMGLGRRVTIVGHSLGSLVAIEIARRYSFAVKRLVLISPPFYKPEGSKRDIWSAEARLRHLYRLVQKRPDLISSLAPLAVKLGVASKSLSITEETLASYVATLEASIINQTALTDIEKLTLPIKIIYGTFDPVIVGKHIRKLAKDKKNITARQLITGHEIRDIVTGIIANEIVATINDAASQRK